MSLPKTIASFVGDSVFVDIDELHWFQGELKTLDKQDFDKLKTSIIEEGVIDTVNVWENEKKQLMILDGHQTKFVLNALRADGYSIPKVKATKILAPNYKKAKAYVLLMSSTYGKLSGESLSQYFIDAELDFSELSNKLDLPGVDLDLESDSLIDPLSEGEGAAPSLAEKFLVPPFSVLDAKQGYWQARKRMWLGIGIRSEVGRGANLLGMPETMLEPDQEKRAAKARAINTHEWVNKKIAEGDLSPGGLNSQDAGEGTSIFDPVLCELAYRWFSPEGGSVLDPFAGGSVRGIVASHCNRKYFGGELRPEQVEANRQQAADLCRENAPIWHCGDSIEIDKSFSGLEADLIFSCPPYADLEVYSDDPADLSTMDYDGFISAYRKIIRSSLSLLKPDRFAVFVIGEVRHKKGGGFYKGFVMDTIRAFDDAGAKLYNEMILATPAGTAALRASKQFIASRKCCKTHQNVLVFCKGDPFKATDACGLIDIPDEALILGDAQGDSFGINQEQL